MTSTNGPKIVETNEDDESILWYGIDSEAWHGVKVWRRFSDFTELLKRLKGKFAESSLPKLPPRSFSLFGPDPKFLEARQAGLQNFLDQLHAAPHLASCPDVVEFLTPKDAAQKARAISIERWKGLSQIANILPRCLPPLPSAGIQEVKTPLGTTRDIAWEMGVMLETLNKFRESLAAAKAGPEALAVIDSMRDKLRSTEKRMSELRAVLSEARAILLGVAANQEQLDFVDQLEIVAGETVSFISMTRELENRALADIVRRTEAAEDKAPKLAVEWYCEQVERLITESLSDDPRVHKEAIKSLKAMKEALSKEVSKRESEGEMHTTSRLSAAAVAASQAIEASKKGTSSTSLGCDVKRFEERMYSLFAQAEAAVGADPGGAGTSSSTIQSPESVHGKIVSLMREMQQAKVELKKKENEERELASTISALDELQQDIAEFEESWSKVAQVKQSSGMLERSHREKVVGSALKAHEEARDEMFPL